MATVNKVLLSVQTPFIIAKRFRGKINIQKPRKPHFERQLLIDLAKPIYGPPKYKIPNAFCDRGVKLYDNKVENPFERILANECLNWFNTSKMVVFVHLNSISMEDKTPILATLAKNEMHLRRYGKKIVGMATKGTRYEAVNHLFTSHQEIIFGQPENAAKLLKILKKTPQLVVMAAIIQDRLMSKNELVKFSQMPNIDAARSQLCAVLDSAGSHLVQQLNQSQQTFVGYLDKHAESLNSDSKKPEELKESQTEPESSA